MLPTGAVGAIKSLRWRVPEDAPEEVKSHADEALGQIVRVMRGEYGRSGMSVLLGAKAVREEICGPQTAKVQHGGNVTVVVKTGVSKGLDERQ